MDNVTHSLTGAVLGQLGLKKKSGLAMPTLIISANLPDIDAVTTLLGTQSLALRRGITHGPIALVLLPLVLTLLMVVFDRRQGANGKRPVARLPVRPGWLLLLAYLGTLSHPLLDWFNSYGVRLLEPFASEWFAANTLFIIDVWLWAALILGVWVSMRRERRGQTNWRAPAVACVAAMVAYVAGNGLITHRAQALVHAHVAHTHGAPATLVVANPVPVAFWHRDLLWRDASQYGDGTYSLLRGGEPLRMSADVKLHLMDDKRVAIAARTDENIGAFLFWSRMPIATLVDNTLTLGDQRFTHPLTRNAFTVTAPLP